VCAMKNNNDLYRQRLIDRITRHLKRSRHAHSLEQGEHKQQRIRSARLYSRRLKHRKQLEDE